MKRCGKCRVTKQESEFSKDSHQPNNLRNSCRSCDSLRSKKFKKSDPKSFNEKRRQYYQLNKERISSKQCEWRKNNPDRDSITQKKTALKRMYGVTLKQYYEKIVSQEYKCPICLKDFDEQDHKPHLDHNHETDQVRGILCVQCNLGLGRFFEDVDTLQKAADYLLSHPREVA